MRIAHLDLDDDLATAAAQTWPDRTWSAVVSDALALAVSIARDADTMADAEADRLAALQAGRQARRRHKGLAAVVDPFHGGGAA